jgi:hypothetical protein
VYKPKEFKAGSGRGIYKAMFIEALFTVASCPSMEEQISKMWYKHVSVCLHCYHEILEILYLKRTEIYFSQFWRLEVQDQGTGRFRVWRGLLFTSKTVLCCYVLTRRMDKLCVFT